MTPDERIALNTSLSLAEIRASFAALGYDLSDLTDEQLEQGIRGVAQMVAASGITSAEATAALVQLAKAGPA